MGAGAMTPRTAVSATTTAKRMGIVAPTGALHVQAQAARVRSTAAAGSTTATVVSATSIARNTRIVALITTPFAEA